MNPTFRSGIAFLVVVIAVVGGIYLIDTYTGWRPFGGSTLMSGIKRSVGLVSPIENDVGLRDLRPGHEDAAMGKRQDQIFRCRVKGKTIYSDVPCDGSRSRIIETHESTGIQTADPWEVEKFRAQALAAKIMGESKPVPGEPSSAPGEPSRVGPDRARCDKLEKYIAYLDERARQQLSASEKAQVKQQRRDKRQETFDLDCMHA